MHAALIRSGGKAWMDGWARASATSERERAEIKVIRKVQLLDLSEGVRERKRKIEISFIKSPAEAKHISSSADGFHLRRDGFAGLSAP